MVAESSRFSKVLVLGVLALVVLVAAWYTYTTVQQQQAQNSDAGQLLLDSATMSGARFTGLAGEETSFAEVVGREFVYINSWASWSPLSRDELIALNEVAGEYADKNISFVALNRKEQKEQAERFLATLPPLPHLKVIIDTEDHVYRGVGGYAMPETIIYNPDGALVRHERVPLTATQMRDILNGLALE